MRENAIAAIVTLLEARSGIKYVQRTELEASLSAQQLPAVLVVDDGAEEVFYKTGDQADVYFTVRLIGVVSARIDASKSMNELDVEIKKAIGSDPRLGGLVASSLIEPMTDKNLNDADSVATFTRPVRVFYSASVAGGM